VLYYTILYYDAVGGGERVDALLAEVDGEKRLEFVCAGLVDCHKIIVVVIGSPHWGKVLKGVHPGWDWSSKPVAHASFRQLYDWGVLGGVEAFSVVFSELHT